ncbi:hypothetical protein D3C72_1653030 [compost metagenome]
MEIHLLSIDEDFTRLRPMHAKQGQGQFRAAGSQETGYAERFSPPQIERNIFKFAGPAQPAHRENNGFVVVIGGDDGAVKIAAGHQFGHP